FIRRHERTVRMTQEAGYRYREGAKRWELMDDAKLFSVIKRDIADFSPKMALRCTPQQIRDIATQIKWDLLDNEFQAKLETWFDGRKGDFVSLQNGILEVQTGRLLPHSPDWFSFNCLPFDYDPQAQCPEFEKYLESVWPGDRDAADCLKLWMGYLMLS